MPLRRSARSAATCHRVGRRRGSCSLSEAAALHDAGIPNAMGDLTAMCGIFGIYDAVRPTATSRG